jgi:hypothetical protein
VRVDQLNTRSLSVTLPSGVFRGRGGPEGHVAKGGRNVWSAGNDDQTGGSASLHHPCQDTFLSEYASASRKEAQEPGDKH